MIEEKNRGKTSCSLRRIMKIRRVICTTGPTIQLTYIIPFIASSPRNKEAYFSPGSSARFLSWPPYSPTIHLFIFLFADSSAAQWHRVATIGNQYHLFCSNTRVLDRGKALWNCTIHPGQRQCG